MTDVIGRSVSSLSAKDNRTASTLAKLAKTMAEATRIQQEGERKAWGLDIVIDPATLKQMTDAQLEAIAAGKSI